jgi:pimeloyl-ACP methyl ester carboxylesterase
MVLDFCQSNDYKLIIVLLLTASGLIFLYSYYFIDAQASALVSANKSDVNSILPVLLIHGYLSNASVWDRWEILLENDSIDYKTVTFENDDPCGKAKDHATELNRIIEDFKNDTRINIVGHSKGGLDARVYLANNLSHTNIANLIMIGTPNAGSPLAKLNDMCSPAILDLRPGSWATKVRMNNNTRYFTIAGDWKPSLSSPDPNCSPRDPNWLTFQRWGNSQLDPPYDGVVSPNDGIVPLPSVQLENSMSLGVSDNCHTDLLGDEEYQMAKKLLLE